MMPRVAHSSALGRNDRVCAEVGHTMETVSLIILPCMALMTVVGPQLGVLLFGQEGAGRYMVPLAAATACGCFQSVLCGGLNATDHQGTAAGIALICDVVQLALTALLMGRPSVGMDGFVAGVVASAVLGLVLSLWAVRRHTGLRVGMGRVLGLPGLAALLSWQTALLMDRWMQEAGATPVLRVGTVLVFGAVIYMSAMFAMGAGQGERNIIFPVDREKLR